MESDAEEAQQFGAEEETQPQGAFFLVKIPSELFSSCLFFFPALKSHLTLPSTHQGAAFMMEMAPLTKESQA